MPDNDRMTPAELEDFENQEVHHERNADFAGPESERDTEAGPVDEPEPTVVPLQNPD